MTKQRSLFVISALTLLSNPQLGAITPLIVEYSSLLSLLITAGGACRIHQFEKVEQFFVTSCNNNASWEAFEEMLSNAEDFYTSLGLHYQVMKHQLYRSGSHTCITCNSDTCDCHMQAVVITKQYKFAWAAFLQHT